MSYIVDKTLVLSIICDTLGSKDEKYLNKRNQQRH